ncbi:MAG: hypothetical protein WKF37_14665 [Bryobacteraceae bacterium]
MFLVDPITVTSGVLFSLSAYVWLREPENNGAAFSFCLSLFLLAMMKPNVAGCLIGPTFLILFSSRAHRVKVSILSLATFLLFLGWLRLHGIDLLDCRVRDSRKASPQTFFADPLGFEALLALICLAYILVVLPGCFHRSWALSQDWRGSSIGLICVLGGLANFISAGESKLVDLSTLLFGVVVVSHARGAWKNAEAANPVARGNLIASYLALFAVRSFCRIRSWPNETSSARDRDE